MLKIREHVPLSELTTFKIGGSSRYFVEVRTEGEVSEAVQWAKQKQIKFVILAGGSNVLIPDDGLRALVIHLAEGNFSFAGERLSIDAGCNLFEMIRAAAKHGWGGWEKLSGIPGTVGGAVRGNAGAFGSEIKDFVTEVRALNSETSEIKEFGNSSCDFSYRHSFFKDYPEWLITGVTVRLTPVMAEESSKLMNETIIERQKRHIQNIQAAGSFFLNPRVPQNIVAMFEKEKKVKSRDSRVPAGWLIEKAGLKGRRVADAAASVGHPNYIINLGAATAKDVLELSEQIKKSVEQRFGISLTEEVAIL